MFDYRINTFLTLYKELNYRKTAEVLNMTQPGVTQHIQLLEKYYGIKLFNYEGRVITPTDECKVVHKYLNKMMWEEKSLRNKFNKDVRVHLRVGATKTIGDFVIIPKLQDFISKENNTIDLIVDNTRVLLQMLDDMKLDFALVEGNFDKNEYEHHLYKKERVVGICSKDHPFSGKKIPITELFKETIILREEGSGTRGLIEEVFNENGYSIKNFNRVMMVSSFFIIQNFISKNKGITFAYLPVANKELGLATFEIEDNPIFREFNFVYLNKKIAKEKIDILFK